MESTYAYIGYGLFFGAFLLWLLAAASQARIIYVCAFSVLGGLYEYAAHVDWPVLNMMIGTVVILLVAGAIWWLVGADGTRNASVDPH